MCAAWHFLVNVSCHAHNCWITPLKTVTEMGPVKSVEIISIVATGCVGKHSLLSFITHSKLTTIAVW